MQMKTRGIQILISLVIGIASFWLILEGGIIGLAVILLILIGLGIPPSLRILRIGIYLSGLGLTGAALMGISALSTAHCPRDGSVPGGGCVEGGDWLIGAFVGVAVIGCTLLSVAALKQRKASTPKLPTSVT